MRKYISKMKTVSFIGSDKNAGKTTAMNFVASKTQGKYCISSIGLNGEIQDNLTGGMKPTIEIKKDKYFLTAAEHLNHLNGSYSIVQILTPPGYFKNYILGKADQDINLTLEGPNEKENWISAKKEIERVIKNGVLLIDGSIDRQFIAHPEISDEFYFCLLSSSREDQQQKAADLIAPLMYSACDTKTSKILRKLHSRSVVLDKKLNPIFLGTVSPFMDEDLFDAIGKTADSTIYLEGALTGALYRKLVSLNVKQVILNNFTLYQNIGRNINEMLDIRLLNPINLNRIFVKEEIQLELTVPDEIPIINLFRENLNEIAI